MGLLILKAVPETDVWRDDKVSLAIDLRGKVEIGLDDDALILLEDSPVVISRCEVDAAGELDAPIRSGGRFIAIIFAMILVSVIIMDRACFVR